MCLESLIIVAFVFELMRQAPLFKIIHNRLPVPSENKPHGLKQPFLATLVSVLPSKWATAYGLTLAD